MEIPITNQYTLLTALLKDTKCVLFTKLTSDCSDEQYITKAVDEKSICNEILEDIMNSMTEDHITAIFLSIYDNIYDISVHYGEEYHTRMRYNVFGYDNNLIKGYIFADDVIKKFIISKCRTFLSYYPSPSTK